MNHSLSKKPLGQKMRARLFAALLLCLLLGFFLLLLLKSADLQSAVSEALLFSAKTLIPALFPFAVLSRFFLQSRLLPSDNKLSRLLTKPFALHASALAALVSGLVCGFPMGAFAASALDEEGLIPKEEAYRIASFANNASAPFLIASAGDLFNRAAYGKLLYAAGSLSSITVGLLWGAIVAKRRSPVKGAKEKADSTPSARAPLLPLAASCTVKAGEAMLVITSFTALFAVIAKALALIPLTAPLAPFLSALLEVSTALRFAASLSSETGVRMALTLAAFAVGWSGLSVVMQSEALFGGKLPLRPLLSARLAIALLSSLLTFLLYPLV